MAAIIEATPITTMRTGGGHAVVAAKYLARRDSSVLTIVGCGEEARAAIRGFLAIFPGLKQLRLCDLRPEAIIEMLGLRRPIYRQTAAYGHFGRADLDLPWERTDCAEALAAAAQRL